MAASSYPNSTPAGAVLSALNGKLKEIGTGKYRGPSPMRSDSNSDAFILTIKDADDGVWYDHVSGDSGTLYDLAPHLGVALPTTKRAYTGLADYAAAHNGSVASFKAAGWREVEYRMGRRNRPALAFPTANGTRYRFLDGRKPPYINEEGYHPCWYGLTRAVEIARAGNLPLVIANGEASVVVAQSAGLPATTVTSGERDSFSPALLAELRKVWDGHVLVAYDCDVPGRKKAVALAAQLRKEGWRTEAVDLGSEIEGYDLADYVGRHGIGTMDALQGATRLDAPAAAVVEQPEPPAVQLLSASSILTTDWPEPSWLIPGLLPTGLTILAGRPKLGKSWLALQIASAVASGGTVLGEVAPRGRVLYCALEDPPRRLKGRMVKQEWLPDAAADFLVLGDFQRLFGDLAQGTAGNRLADLIRANGYSLVVIDTLARAMVGDPNDPEPAKRALGALQVAAHDIGCAVLLVDHHRKPTANMPDVINDILGSTDKGAVLDTAWGLYRERGKPTATLMVTGRDVEETSLVVTMDWEYGRWTLEGTADDVHLTDNRRAILNAVERLGLANLTEIATYAEKPKPNAYRTLSDLVATGAIVRDGQRYRVATHTDHDHDTADFGKDEYDDIEF